jgi:hypothetical protein
MRSRVLAATAVGLMLALGSGATARSGVAIQNYDNVPIVRADNAVLTSARVRTAIINATLHGKNKWTILEDTPGRILANMSIRSKHSLTVEVRYSESAFSIVYQDSSNLNYAQGSSGPVIHPTYNKQVKALLDAINASLQRV